MSLPDWQRKFRECAEMRDAALDREAGTSDALDAAIFQRNEQRARAEAAEAEVERLRKALREIADGSWGAQAQHVHYDVCKFARRALAHEEEP